MVKRLKQQLKRLQNSPIKLPLIAVLILIGLATIVATKAAVTGAFIEPENGFKSANAKPVVINSAAGAGAIKFTAPGTTSNTCGRRQTNYTYTVPFGTNAAWNQPICDVPLHPKSATYASRFYNYANGLNVTPQPGDYEKGNLAVKFGLDADPYASFGRNVYLASDSDRQTYIFSNKASSNLDNAKFGDIKRTIPDRKIPWNPLWKTGKGGDNEIVILEDRENSQIPAGLGPKGSLYEIAGYHPLGYDANRLCDPLGLNVLFNSRPQICTYTVNIMREPQNNTIVDYRTYEGSTGSRGGGISYYATLTTPEEVTAGEIRHALGIGVFNTMFGPPCTAAELALGTKEGETCGTAIAPAGKFEWGSGPRDGAAANLAVNQTVPEGMRIRLKDDSTTNAQIDSWLNGQNYSAAKKRTARIFITALQDYGAIVVDTGGVSQVQVAASANPDAKAKWAENGILVEEDKRFLFGLITSSNLEVVAAPTNNCITGVASKFYCEYLTSSY